MIVKNEAANLEACISPVRDLVDEVIVVDTGSADDTRTIASELGARVFEFPWCDSFATARNQAIDHAAGDWIFILDADDRVAPTEVEKLRKLFASLPDRNVGYLMGVVCITADGGVGTEVEHVRLFRRSPQVRFRYRVHEQIIPDLEAVGGTFESSRVRLIHVGYRDSRAVDDKIARNLALVEKDCAEFPLDPFPNFYRGVMLTELGRHAEAIVALELCKAHVLAGSAMFRSLSYGLAHAQRADGDLPGALETIRDARRANGIDAALACMEAEILIVMDDLPGAGASLVPLATRELRDLTTQDLRLRALFSEVLLALGHHEAAEQSARDVIAKRPGFGLPWLVLADALLARNAVEELRGLIANLARIRGAEIARIAVRAAELAHSGAGVEALAEVDTALEMAPSERTLVALRERLHSQGHPRLPLASCLGSPWTDVRRKETKHAHVHSPGLRHHSWQQQHDHAK
jgi:hypothetical protein